MKFLLYQDNTLALDLKVIAENLNRIFDGAIEFSEGQDRLVIPDSYITNPTTYEKLTKLKRLRTEIEAADEALIITQTPYDNNYFWDSPSGKAVVFSTFGWEELTNLSMSNGLIFCLSFLIANRVGIAGLIRHDKATGCINDFLWDKTNIDVCMRSAFVCQDCLKKFAKRKLDGQEQRIYKSLLQLLNDLSSASRANTDIVHFWSFRVSEPKFDVFLCHNSEDKEQIRVLADKLKRSGIRPWLDEEQIPPGRSWQDALEESIPKIKSAAVFVGESGYGPWQKLEMKALLQEFASRQCPVIPVMLRGCVGSPELPLFMRQFMWVDFRKPRPDPLSQLVWGITGQKMQ